MAILPSMGAVERVCADIDVRDTSRSVFRGYGFFAAPMDDGYRGKHPVPKFTGQNCKNLMGDCSRFQNLNAIFRR